MIYAWAVRRNGIFLVRNSFTPDVRSFIREKHALAYMGSLTAWL